MEKNNIISAQVEFAKGNISEAKSICFTLLKSKKDADIYNLLGVIAFSEKKFLESLIYLNKCLKISNNHYKALNNLALVLIDTKKFKKAVHFLNLALKKK